MAAEGEDPLLLEAARGTGHVGSQICSKFTNIYAIVTSIIVIKDALVERTVYTINLGLYAIVYFQHQLDCTDQELD